VIWLFLLLFAIDEPQDKGESVTLHVKEVHRARETTEYGFLSHITAVAESKTIAYSIQCDESYSNKTGGYTLRCSELSAGKDYSARRFRSVISFWPPEAKGEGYLLGMYEIISEKEK